MPKVTVDTVTITKIGDSVSVHAGNKPHVFSDAQEAVVFAREALGISAFETWQEKVFRAIDDMKPMTATEVINRQNAYYAKPTEQKAKTSAVDICNMALSKLGEKGKGPLTPAGIAEQKRQEKNRKQRERAAKKRKAAKRKK